jgi:3-dehydroquinate synthase
VRVPARPGGFYDVTVGEGLLDRLGELCRAAAPARRYAVVSDARVAELYGERAVTAFRSVGLDADLHAFPEGERSKTRATWASLTDALLAAGHGRDSVVVALGGGVSGDLGGFVAATYMRGVPVVQVPTSLLAMVDSSVGGKTGVDASAGKNLVGAFHHPALVLADPVVLGTLEPRHVAAGLAEAVKTAAVADAALLEWIAGRAGPLLRAEPAPIAELVRRCVAIKGAVVGRDPEESGRRAVLNFGHTVGHALEQLSGYELLHGDAVAAGMRVEARVGEALGVTRPGTAARLAGVLDACGHRSRPEADRAADEVLAAARVDKKARDGTVRTVLLAEPGQAARGPGGVYTHPLEGPGAIRALAGALRSASEDADSGSGTLPDRRASPRRESAPEA